MAGVYAAAMRHAVSGSCSGGRQGRRPEPGRHAGRSRTRWSSCSGGRQRGCTWGAPPRVVGQR